METKTSKPRKQLILSAQDVDDWVVSYETTGKLPQINIPCSKCKAGIVAGHDNLRSKVKKYGGIKPLLTTFVCRECKTGTLGSVAPSTVARKVRVVKKLVKISKAEQKREAIRNYEIPKVNPNHVSVRYSIDDLANNVDLAREFTNGVCIRPQLFLNNDRSCDDCVLYTNCACNAKTLSKARRKQMELEK